MKKREYIRWMIVASLLVLSIVSINIIRDTPHEAVDKWKETHSAENVKEYINLKFIASDMYYIKLENGEILKLTLKKDFFGDWDVAGTENADPEEIAERLYKQYEERKIPVHVIESFLNSLEEDGMDTATVRIILKEKGVPLQNDNEKE